MRVPSSLLMVLLLCTSLQLASSGPASIDNNQDCCFKLTQMKIPLARIKSYWWTSSSCYIKAVVFQTEVRGNLCVDPAASWVSGHLIKLNRRRNSAGNRAPAKPRP